MLTLLNLSFAVLRHARPGGAQRFAAAMLLRLCIVLSVVTGLTVGAPPTPALAAAPWSTTGSLGTARDGHTATLLPNGKVLVAGGHNGDYLPTAEVYDPATGVWSVIRSLGTALRTHRHTSAEWESAGRRR